MTTQTYVEEDWSGDYDDELPITPRLEVAPFREAFQRSGMSLTDLARQLGWYRRNREHPQGVDTTRVARVLGLRPKLNGRGERTVVSSIDYDRAVLIVQALGLDPVDFREAGL